MLISIDPGARTGYAIWSRDQIDGITRFQNHNLVSWGFCHLKKTKRSETPFFMARELLDDIGVTNGDTVIIENQWHIDAINRAKKGQGAAGNFASVKRLIEYRCALQHAAELLGGSVHLVDPGIWMRQLAGKMPQRKPGERVRALVGQALGVYTSLDESAAIGLGMWWIIKSEK